MHGLTRETIRKTADVRTKPSEGYYTSSLNPVFLQINNWPQIGLKISHKSSQDYSLLN